MTVQTLDFLLPMDGDLDSWLKPDLGFWPCPILAVVDIWEDTQWIEQSAPRCSHASSAFSTKFKINIFLKTEKILHKSWFPVLLLSCYSRFLLQIKIILLCILNKHNDVTGYLQQRK